MASGAVLHSRAQVSVAVTGIAGPAGGSMDKPVGTVWFGFMVDGLLASEMKRFDGNRATVRRESVEHALSRLLELLGQTATG
jgi:nicotinamide-nucleotide amidase